MRPVADPGADSQRGTRKDSLEGFRTEKEPGTGAANVCLVFRYLARPTFERINNYCFRISDRSPLPAHS